MKASCIGRRGERPGSGWIWTEKQGPVFFLATLALASSSFEPSGRRNGKEELYIRIAMLDQTKVHLISQLVSSSKTDRYQLGILKQCVKVTACFSYICLA